MCGIAGFVQRRPGGAALGRMLAQIARRGPDGESEWRARSGDWHVELGHRRLAIIDLVDGIQPMHNEDGSVTITYNGEVYNYRSLRERLEGSHAFKTRSDTEVIIHHFEQSGVDGLIQLDGMFAFAIWDSAKCALTLARDRAGIKPLYYAELADGGIAFASELRSLLAHGNVDETLSAEGLASYFFSDYAHAPLTLIGKVRKLLPGHTLVWRDGHVEPPRPFWQISLANATTGQDESALADELWTRLGTAVESQLVADVPVGIFLSGGIDSSCVATLAAERAGARMKAFSIGFENETFDEIRYARAVADRLNVEHVTETLHEKNLIDIVDEALDGLDEPVADPSFLPTYLLSRLAARHVKVVVGGDGGDELWGGYPTYLAHRYGSSVYARVPAWVRRRVETAIGLLPVDDRYQSLEWKLRRFTGRWDDDQLTRHLRWMSSVDLPDLARAVPAARSIVPETLHTSLPASADWLQRILALDFTTYMPGSVLTKVDRASMAHGLEVRPPFLANEMIDWAFRVPTALKVRRGKGKILLKLAAKGKLPQQVIDRPKKGFGIPLSAWLRGPLRAQLEDTVRGSPLWSLGLLDRGTFATWHDEHQAKSRDHSKPLWALFVLDRWFRHLQAFARRET